MTVTPDNIRSLTWEACQENPCQHKCKIIHKNGTTISKLLDGDRIAILAHAMKLETSHFATWSPVTVVSYQWCCCPITYELTATDILTELFETALSLHDEKEPLFS